MNSTVLPSFQFGMNCQGFAAARLVWPEYADVTKLENSSVWKDRIIVASTCRHSVQFGCYITWLQMDSKLCLTLSDDNSYWLNPPSLGTMSASAYIDNLA